MVSPEIEMRLKVKFRLLLEVQFKTFYCLHVVEESHDFSDELVAYVGGSGEFRSAQGNC